jgi:hypothetical protein
MTEFFNRSSEKDLSRWMKCDVLIEDFVIDIIILEQHWCRTANIFP